jgi:hypothetical protein
LCVRKEWHVASCFIFGAEHWSSITTENSLASWVTGSFSATGTVDTHNRITCGLQ